MFTADLDLLPQIGHNGGPPLPDERPRDFDGTPIDVQVEIPETCAVVFFNPDGTRRRSDGKVLHGGRGSGKSWAAARALILLAWSGIERVLCTREFQSSIKDSVHRLLKDQIYALGLQADFDIQRDSIKCLRTGSEFLFKGLRHSINEIKSTEGITICWVEEAQSVSAESWVVLLPTIRADGAEVWVTFNPDQDDDPTYDFVKNPPPGWIVQQVNWSDNPYFLKDGDSLLNRQRVACLERDPEAYDWIWEGKTRKISDAVIFRNRVHIEDFEEPPDVRPYYGLDFGFSTDPTAFVRGFILSGRDAKGADWEDLYITHAQFGYGVEIDDLPTFMRGGEDSGGNLWEGLPGAEDWPIKADAADPAKISYLGRQGFSISAAEKWPNSVEEGVQHLKGFRRIVVRPELKELREEFRLYSFKRDKVQKDAQGNPLILPLIVDRWNHGIDAIRYALDGFIGDRGGLRLWEKMAD